MTSPSSPKRTRVTVVSTPSGEEGQRRGSRPDGVTETTQPQRASCAHPSASLYWSDETIMLELGERAFMASDEGTAIEHRLARANGLTYGCPPRHWSWVVIPDSGGSK